MTIEEALRHAGDLKHFPAQLYEDVASFMPAYMWIVDNYSGHSGWPDFDVGPTARLIHCGACDWETVEEKKGRRYRESYKQCEFVRCPRCHSTVEVKHVSRGISTIYNRLNVVWYQKSAIDPDVVVAIAAHCVRLYRLADRWEPWTLEPDIEPRGIAVFDYRNRDALRLQLRPVFERTAGYCFGYDWKPVKSMHRLTFGEEALFPYQKSDQAMLVDWFNRAIRGTPIERAWHEKYMQEDCVKALDRICRYHCCEYMTKLGLENFVMEDIMGALPGRLVNWNGNSMARVLKLSKERLGQLKGKGIRLTPELLAVLQWADKAGVRCGIETAEGVACTLNIHHASPREKLCYALGLLPEGKWAKALKYIARNRNRAIDDIRDLWSMTKEAGGSLTDDADLFPKDFRQAHDRLAARIRATKDAAKDALIARQLKKLTKKYGFSFGGLTLRPAGNSYEVIREGQVLHHCVGSYVNNYAAGKTVICVLRRDVEPDSPWRTVEISATTGKVLQDRGYHNDWGDNDLRTPAYRAALALFWEAWDERNKKARASA